MSVYAQGYPAATVPMGMNAAGEPIPRSDFVPVGTVTLPVTDSLDPYVATLTSDETAPSDGDTVVIGSITYTYKSALTAPAVAYEVLIGADAAAALDNLKSAINATAGAGSTYGTGTAAHPDVTATTNSDTEQVIQAITAGVITAPTLAETSSHLSWGAWSGGAGRIALPATGTSLLLQNTSDKDAFVALGDASVTTATTSGFPILAGTRVVIGRTLTHTHLAALCASGETATLYATAGSGFPILG